MFCKHCGHELFDGDRICPGCQKPVSFKPRKYASTPNKIVIILIVMILLLSLTMGLYVIYNCPQMQYKKEQCNEIAPDCRSPEDIKSNLKIILTIDESILANEPLLSTKFPIIGEKGESFQNLLMRKFPGATYHIKYKDNKKQILIITVTFPNGAFFNLQGYFEVVTDCIGKPMYRPVIDKKK